MSSGDFGLAYLTERWAARFVTELMKNYTVYFIGYSISDPVMRYIMDALAADQIRGECVPEMFAFGSYSKGKEYERANEWCAKNVTPILYREYRRHFYLHKTLREWSAIYRDGVLGKERIVVECAMAKPLASTSQDNFVGRMLWALADTKGLPAKRFAQLDPVPSLDWLEPLCWNHCGYSDLSRFNVSPQPIPDNKLEFSLTNRPAPYDLAPWMRLVDEGASNSQWDKLMLHLACWLIRHLDNPRLVLWVAKSGGRMHDGFADLVGHRLDELDKFQRKGNDEELARIQEGAPHAIPRPAMRVLWRLILAGRHKARSRDFNLYNWVSRFKIEGLTPTLRTELREILTPYVVLSEPLHWHVETNEISAHQQIRELVNWKIVLSGEYVHAAFRDLSQFQGWLDALPSLLPDFSLLLRDVLDLMSELGEADSQHDGSYTHQPSISEHPQNKNLHAWTVLIDFTRDAWLASVHMDHELARLSAESWRLIPYPLFKRLTFFAASHADIIPSHQALEWLLADDTWWLWSVETQRETINLIIAIIPNLDRGNLTRLENAILEGPPREMFRDDIEQERWSTLVDRTVWLRLTQAWRAGATLSDDAQRRLSEIRERYPSWQIADDERDQFPIWTHEGGELLDVVVLPRRRRELVSWLLENPSPALLQRNDWRERCLNDFPTTACALYALARDGVWLKERWRDALYVWFEGRLRSRSWRYLGPILADAPDEFIQAIANSVSLWLQAAASTIEVHDSSFLRLCRRILVVGPIDGISRDEPVQEAINHPVGHVTEALLNWWYRVDLDDDQGLPRELQPIFSEICNTQIEKFRYGRVLLAAHIITLYRVDCRWTTTNLLPLFDWEYSAVEAHAMWSGFLWSPRLYRPLMAVIKDSFLSTAQYYDSLGEFKEQYAAVLTFAALDPGDTFTVAELANAMRELPPHGLYHAAQALVRTLESSGEQRSDYWRYRVHPYLKRIWPNFQNYITPEISESLARLCLEAGEMFPEALRELKDWLRPLDCPQYIISRLHDTQLCEHSPDDALKFLDLVLGDNVSWSLSNLNSCLDTIRLASPNLISSLAFIRINEIIQQNSFSST